MKYTIICLLSMMLASQAASAQDQQENMLEQPVRKRDSTKAMNGWYFELAGQSLLGVSVNYERSLSKKPGGFLIHAGFGGIAAVFGDAGTFGYIAVPVGLSYAIPVSKNKKHFIEIGGNYVNLAGESVIDGTISYRLIAKPRGLLVRASLIPIVHSTSEGSSFGPWFGVSIGKRF